MFKKILSVVLAVAMIASLCVVFASCQTGNADFKLGVILLHDEFSTYDLNFMNGIEEARIALGLSEDQVIIKKNIPESNDCYEAACDLIDEGCDVIFADSFGHETYLIKAAKENPDVEFCHATGTMAHTSGLDNFHNAFAAIYEGRFLAGVAAGLKLNEMIDSGKITAEEAKMGYVGAFTYSEVMSGYTSFYLGAKSVCPSVTMDVQFTGSWYDVTAEKNAAEALLARDCVLISQHADSMGAPGACEAAGVPNVSYNGSTYDACPETFIVSSAINWAPYYVYITKCYVNNEAIATNWCGGIEEGSVVLSGINLDVAAEGTVEAINDAIAKLKDGSLKVFAADTFTVGGAAAESTLVFDGYFHESEAISAPSFDLRIDGITLLNEKY